MSDIQNERIRKARLLDDLSLNKREQSILKKEYTNTFVQKLEDILEKCFLKTKERKELFVSKERLTLDLLKLLQTQKRFKESPFIHNDLCNLGVFDHETNLVGRIETINVRTKQVVFATLDLLKNNKPYISKSFEKVDFFDIFSLKMQRYYEKQKLVYDCYSFKEVFELLTGKEIFKKIDDTVAHYSLGRGMPLNKGVMDRSNNMDIKD